MKSYTLHLYDPAEGKHSKYEMEDKAEAMKEYKSFKDGYGYRQYVWIEEINYLKYHSPMEQITPVQAIEWMKSGDSRRLSPI